MDATMTSNPTYNVLAFNARKQLVEIHQQLSDILHYQSHIQLDTATSLPPGTLTANRHEQDVIITLIKEEHLRLQTLKHLIDIIDTNDAEILGLYEESKDTHAEDWGALAWGPLPDWEQHPLVQQLTLIALPQLANPPPTNKE